MESIEKTILEMGEKAKRASHMLATLTTEQKNIALKAMADELVEATSEILSANRKDLEKGKDKGLSPAMLDRLALDADRVEFIASCIRQVAELEDPVGEQLDIWDRPNGINIEKIRVPIGVIGIIYESRPNVTADAASLCFKSGNVTILKGGSEAFHSNQEIAKALAEGCEKAGVPEGAIQLVPFTDRESVKCLAEMDQYLDLIIPRGGKGLIETVVQLARMPVIKHYDGICHTYVDKKADIEKAIQLVVDAKTQKPSVCNALETVLVHQDVVVEVLPRLLSELSEKGVKFHVDESVYQSSTVEAFRDKFEMAKEASWTTEYLDYEINVKIVENLNEAIEHINHYSSSHSDCIVTEDSKRSDEFLARIDSACVFWNVSTRFSDGEEFGFGAEIGISTDKLHARGPMALKELTSYKYLIRGNGQTKS